MLTRRREEPTYLQTHENVKSIKWNESIIHSTEKPKLEDLIAKQQNQNQNQTE